MKLLLITLLMIIPGEARATLGESASSVESDRAVFAASRSQAPRQAATFRVEQLDQGGVVIREYVSSRDGLVFGVAWSGMVHPDLSVLLGSNHDEYQRAARETPRRMGARNHRTIAGRNVVVETWGHMRALGGHAFLPALLPDGVTANEIR